MGVCAPTLLLGITPCDHTTDGIHMSDNKVDITFADTVVPLLPHGRELPEWRDQYHHL